MFIIGLRRKFVSPGSKAPEESGAPKTPGQMDLFGQADAVVKHVLEVNILLSIEIILMKLE